MIRTVLDTNVLVSSILSPDAVPGRIVRAWKNGAFEICLSPPLFEEVAQVLARPHIQKLAKYSTEQINGFLEQLLRISLLVEEPLSVEPVVEDDPDDDIVLATALAAGADAIVSGDHHLLEIKNYRGIPIVTPRDFLDLLGVDFGDQ